LFGGYNYWGYVIGCDFAVEGHIILKILLKVASYTKPNYYIKPGKY
jgi:hypothetical protein